MQLSSIWKVLNSFPPPFGEKKDVEEILRSRVIVIMGAKEPCISHVGQITNTLTEKNIMHKIIP